MKLMELNTRHRFHNMCCFFSRDFCNLYTRIFPCSLRPYIREYPFVECLSFSIDSLKLLFLQPILFSWGFSFTFLDFKIPVFSCYIFNIDSIKPCDKPCVSVTPAKSCLFFSCLASNIVFFMRTRLIPEDCGAYSIVRCLMKLRFCIVIRMVMNHSH